MHYMPAKDNGAYFPPTANERIKIRSFSAHVLRECLDPGATDETLIGYFPGRTFFGRFLAPANADEIRACLDVLRAVRTAHGLLSEIDFLLDEPDELAMDLAKEVMKLFNGGKGITVSFGEGYCESLNPEGSIPQCHVLKCEISADSNYFRWLKSRVEAYEGAAQSFRSTPVFFLNTNNRVILEELDSGGNILIDIYGIQSLKFEWDMWLEAHETSLPSPGPAGIEAIAGLLHLADLLATIHLATAAPIVEYGVYYRPTAGDSLTDFWVKMYDATGDMGYVVGNCEVCGQMFIGTSKNKRGHKACLNKKRVKLSRARKFKALLEAGASEKEASRLASISVESARGVLAAEKSRANADV
jgi:hypothetical protein